MRMLAKILPSILAARLSCKTGDRRYTSLVLAPQGVRKVQKGRQDQNLLCSNSAVKKFGEANEISKKVRKESNVFLNKNEERTFLSIALIDLNCIEFNPALKTVQAYREIEEKDAKSLKDFQIDNNANFSNNGPFNANQDSFLLADAFNKIFRITTNNISESLTLSPVIKTSASNLKVKDISFSKNMPFCAIRSSSLNTFLINLAERHFSTNTTAFRQTSLSDASVYGPQILSVSSKSSFEKVVTLIIKYNVSSKSCNRNPNYDYPFISKLFDTENLLMSSDAYNQALIEAAKLRKTLKKGSAESQKIKTDFSRPQVTNIQMGSVKQDAQHAMKSELKSSNPCPPPSKTISAADGGCKKNDPCKPPACPDPCKDELEKLHKNEATKKKNKKPTGCESPKCKRDECKKPPKSPCKAAKNQKLCGEFERTSESPREVKQLEDKTPTRCVCSYCKKTSEGDKKVVSQQPMKCDKKVKSDSSGIAKGLKQKDPCADEHREYKPKCNTDPCKVDKPSSGDAKKPSCPTKIDESKKKPDSSTKTDPKDQDPCKRRAETLIHKKDQKQKDPCSDEHKEYKPKCNTDPCKVDKPSSGDAQKKQDSPKAAKDPCKRKGETLIHKKDPCEKKQKDDPCKKEKEDPCKKQKEDPCTKKKEDPQGNSKKQDPCKNENKNPCEIQKQKDDPCKKEKKKEDPCKKEKNKEDPCKKEKKKEDPCKKEKKKEDPCKKKTEHAQGKGANQDPCKKEKKNPCEIKKGKEEGSSSSTSENKTEKGPSSPCKPKPDTKAMSQKSSSTNCNSSNPNKETRPNCGKSKQSFSTLAATTEKNLASPKRETKPNCGQHNKSYSTLAATSNSNSSTSLMKLSLTTLPSISIRNFYSFGSIRHFSSKRNDKNKKRTEDFGKISQCKSVGTRVPPHRKPAYNPHPKGALRQCYPTYDMDCKKLCKDAHKTACKKFAFLKDTDNNKRNN